MPLNIIRITNGHEPSISQQRSGLQCRYSLLTITAINQAKGLNQRYPSSMRWMREQSGANMPIAPVQQSPNEKQSGVNVAHGTKW